MYSSMITAAWTDTPNNARNPTRDETLKFVRVTSSASKPPMRASATLTRMRIAHSNERKHCVQDDENQQHGQRHDHFIVAARHAASGGKVLMGTAGMSAKESSVALKLGLVWHLPRTQFPGSLATTIHLVMSGEMWVDQKVIQLMADQVQQGGTSQPRTLAHRGRAADASGGFCRARQQRDCRSARSYRRGGEGFIAAIIPKDLGADPQPARPNRAGGLAGNASGAIIRRA